MFKIKQSFFYAIRRAIQFRLSHAGRHGGSNNLFYSMAILWVTAFSAQAVLAQGPASPTLQNPSVRLEHTESRDKLLLSGGWRADLPAQSQILQVYINYREVVGWETITILGDPPLVIWVPIYRGRPRALNLGVETKGTFVDKPDWVRHELGDRQFEVWISVTYRNKQDLSVVTRESVSQFVWAEHP